MQGPARRSRRSWERNSTLAADATQPRQEWPRKPREQEHDFAPLFLLDLMPETQTSVHSEKQRQHLLELGTSDTEHTEYTISLTSFKTQDESYTASAGCAGTMSP